MTDFSIILAGFGGQGILSAGRIVEIPQVNGLHHRYDREAA